MLGAIDTADGVVGSKGRNSVRRQQVIDAAAATFSRLGYHGASTRAIADLLGIKVASLYFHIASKDDALEEICSLGTYRALHYLGEALEEADDLTGRLRHFFRHQRDDLATHAEYVSVAIFESRHLTPVSKVRFGKLTGEFRHRVEAVFADAAVRGELHAALSPRQARFILIGTMRTISELYVGGHARDFDNIMLAWVETTVRGLVASYVAPD